MARKWKDTVDLKDTWSDYSSGTYEIEDVVDELMAQLRLCDKFIGDEELDQIMERMELIAAAADPEEVREKEFDAEMGKLYDWADKGRRLLIITA